MDGTPKLQRKASLSLTTRLNHKRHSASPQNRMKTSSSNGNINSRDYNCEALQRSPSVISICSDGGIECTPPHKKIIMNLDDSLDYSPKVFDSSFSPTCLLSQTLAIDSPEVGWKWSRHSNGGRERGGAGGCGFEDASSTRTPDSAYAADSSFASAGSSSTELLVNVRTRSDRLTYDTRREDQRKMLEQELRRVEKTRAEEKLKQRCAKLQEQLKSAGTQKSNTSTSQNTIVNGGSCSNNNIISSNSTSMDVEMRTQTSFTATTTTTASTVIMMTPEKPKKQETLTDFFNDSDSDCFLLAATQEIESKIDVKTQPAFMNNSKNSTNSPTDSTISDSNTITHANSAPAVTTTPTTSSSNKEKRSSFYMKFLEDDCPDDWFVSLDEAILQATQSKKPRTSLQRYKSMPTATATNTATAAAIVNNKNINNSDSILNSKTNVPSSRLANSSDTAATSSSSSNLSRMKRHSSTHSLSPASSNYRGRQLQLKK